MTKIHEYLLLKNTKRKVRTQSQVFNKINYKYFNKSKEYIRKRIFEAKSELPIDPLKIQMGLGFGIFLQSLIRPILDNISTSNTFVDDIKKMNYEEMFYSSIYTNVKKLENLFSTSRVNIKLDMSDDNRLDSSHSRYGFLFYIVDPGKEYVYDRKNPFNMNGASINCFVSEKYIKTLVSNKISNFVSKATKEKNVDTLNLHNYKFELLDDIAETLKTDFIETFILSAYSESYINRAYHDLTVIKSDIYSSDVYCKYPLLVDVLHDLLVSIDSNEIYHDVLYDSIFKPCVAELNEVKKVLLTGANANVSMISDLDMLIKLSDCKDNQSTNGAAALADLIFIHRMLPIIHFIVYDLNVLSKHPMVDRMLSLLNSFMNTYKSISKNVYMNRKMDTLIGDIEIMISNMKQAYKDLVRKSTDIFDETLETKLKQK